MLFDLRSRGRRRTVQGVYLGLALLMGLGLVLFGVGAGNGIGGLLNAFTGNGSGNSAQVVNQQEQSALKAVKADPNSASAWGELVQGKYTSAGEGSNYNSTTATFSASGKKELRGATQAWQRYLQLTKSPDPNIAILAARAYEDLGDYSGAASAWESETAASPAQVGYACLAANAYAAGQTRKGDLAMSQAISMTPKAQQATLKTEIASIKRQPSLIRQAC